ncbi:Insulin [Orchesella cincta]|uniref:Insulin n=1 Tax=Orchesella cincta TaxID=48709 RepID=A0A1D2N550_ORCCI|nr:Insulin [Orchesella cincta]
MGMAAERRRAIWSVLFLVLSQSFGGTLQCVTSSAHPKERIIVSNDYETTAPEQGVSQVQSHHYGPGSLEEDENEKALSSSELSGMENPIFLRVARREEHGDHGRQHHSAKPISEQEATVQLCSYRLREELVKICDGKFHEPISHVENSIGPTDAATRQARKRSMRKRGQEILRRVPRNLVDQCCKNQCRKQDMLKYCDRRTPTVDSLINSRRIEVIADPTDGTPSTEETNDLNMDNSAGSDYDDDGASVRVRGINAVTSTLPSRIISFGRGTYDT